MDPLTLAGLGIGIFQGLTGRGQKKKAEAIASRNIRPVRRKASGVTDNLALTESDLSNGGLSAEAKTAYSTGADRGMSSTIEAVLRSGSGNNLLGDVYDDYQQGYSKLALAEDQARMQKVDNYLKANTADANEDDLNWQINEYAPWADKAQQAAKLSEEGTKNISGGINTVMGTAASYVQGRMNPDAGLGGTTKKSSSSVPATRFSTTMLAPNPKNINYTDRSLTALNSLGMLPMNNGVLVPEYKKQNLSGIPRGSNSYPFITPREPAFDDNWY